MSRSSDGRRFLPIAAALLLSSGRLECEPALRWRRPCIGEAIAFAPNSKTLAVAGGIGSVLLFDVADWSLRECLTGHTDTVRALAYSADGRWLASGSNDGTVRMWYLQQGEQSKVVDAGAPVTTVAFSPSGDLLATGQGQSVKIWKTDSGALLRSLTHHDYVSQVSFSPDGRQLAAVSLGAVLVWGVESGELLGPVAGPNAICLAFSPDGTTLALSRSDAQNGPAIQVLSTDDWHTTAVLDVISISPVTSLAYSPDGDRLALTAGRWGGIVSAGDGLRLRKCPSALYDTHDVAFSPDGKLVAFSYDQEVGVYDARTGALLRRMPSLAGAVESAAFSPDGRMLATTGDFGRLSSENKVVLWDAANGRLLSTLDSPGGVGPVESSGLWRFTRPQYTSVAFSPDGDLLACASSWSSAIVWNLSDGTVLRELTTQGWPPSQITAVAFSPDNRLLAGAARDGQVDLWRLNDGGLELRTDTNQRVLRSLAWAPDGRRLATGGADGSIRIWQLPSGMCSCTMPAPGHFATPNALVFAPDSETLVSGCLDGTVRVWETNSGLQRLVLAGHAEGNVAVALGPAGRLIASCCPNDGLVKLWRLSDGELVATLASLRGASTSVAFSPRSGDLACAGYGGLTLWDVTGP